MARDDIVLSVPVGNGKYTVQQDRKGMLTALRHEEPWRDCCGDGLILTLAQEVSDLRAAMKIANQALMEVSHAQNNGAGWYTKGESGLYQQVSMWVQRGLAAIKSCPI